MPSAAFASGIIGGYVKTVQAERQRRDKNMLDAAQFLLQSGRAKDLNDVLPLLGDTLQGPFGSKGSKGKGGAGGGKGGQQDPTSLLGALVNPALAKGQQGAPGQPGQGSKPLYTEDEAQARAEAAQRRADDEQLRLYTEQQRLATEGRIAVEQAKPLRGVADKQATQKPDGTWAILVRDPNSGQVIYEQPANAPKQTGALAERTKQVLAQTPGITPDRAEQVAALQLQNERQTRQRESSARLQQYLATSRQALVTNQERYNEMKETFPYTLAAKMSGAEVASLRPTVIRQTLERGSVALDLSEERLQELRQLFPVKAQQAATNLSLSQERYKAATTAAQTKADAEGQKEAAKILAQATKTAATLAGKQSSILMGLGLEDDERTIRQNLIRELSGGVDPDVVEALANAQVRGVSPTTPGGSDATRRVEARKYLAEHHLPLTDANIQHYLAQTGRPQGSSAAPPR